MRQLLAVGFLALVVACTPDTAELDLCADEQTQFDEAIDQLEVLVNDWSPKHSRMTERIARGEAISAEEISAFETAQAEYAESLFDGQEETSALLARISVGCTD